MLQSFGMSFDGRLLKRGFWLYIWEIKGPFSPHVYVGRTGDSSSPNASSPFRRIGQHLDPRPGAKGNALGRQLKNSGIDCEECSFEMTALGPIFPEQATFEAHVPFRNQMAALERAVADLLRHRGYIVLGTHPRARTPDQGILCQIQKILSARFKVVSRQKQPRKTSTQG